MWLSPAFDLAEKRPYHTVLLYTTSTTTLWVSSWRGLKNLISCSPAIYSWIKKGYSSVFCCNTEIRFCRKIVKKWTSKCIQTKVFLQQFWIATCMVKGMIKDGQTCLIFSIRKQFIRKFIKYLGLKSNNTWKWPRSIRLEKTAHNSCYHHGHQKTNFCAIA